VVEHIGCSSTTTSSAPSLRRKSGVRISIVVLGDWRSDGIDHIREMLRAAIVQIIAVHRRDDHMARPRLAHRMGDAARFVEIQRVGRPVRTLQKAQARVHTSPMIMKVACFLDQHSPIFGQPASSHTVTSPLDRTMVMVSL
jgi:hypothetical protein